MILRVGVLLKDVAMMGHEIRVCKRGVGLVTTPGINSGSGEGSSKVIEERLALYCMTLAPQVFQAWRCVSGEARKSGT